jgi:Domain of unknown function (DUF4918)
MQKKTFAEKVISFYNQLDLKLPSELQVSVLNPYKEEEVRKCVSAFYRKYFNDQRRRTFIMGINPGRFGGGRTGISFTDPVALRKFCGIENNFGNKRELSSEFIYLMIEEFGGIEKFYRYFFISAVCPLGFTKGTKNYNYFDEKPLLDAVQPFIKKTFQQQIEMGAREDVLVCIGYDKNRKFLEKLNDELKYFKRIIALGHPRFIMQYRRKKLNEYLRSYVETLSEISTA